MLFKYNENRRMRLNLLLCTTKYF